MRSPSPPRHHEKSVAPPKTPEIQPASPSPAPPFVSPSAGVVSAASKVMAKIGDAEIGAVSPIHCPAKRGSPTHFIHSFHSCTLRKKYDLNLEKNISSDPFPTFEQLLERLGLFNNRFGLLFDKGRKPGTSSVGRGRRGRRGAGAGVVGGRGASESSTDGHDTDVYKFSDTEEDEVSVSVALAAAAAAAAEPEPAAAPPPPKIDADTAKPTPSVDLLERGVAEQVSFFFSGPNLKLKL